MSNINQNFISQFSANLFYLLEQQGSKLKGIFPMEVAKGEKHFFDRLGSFSATAITSRLEPTVLQDADHSRRMAPVNRYHASAYLDTIDKLKMLIDPTNDYAVKLANAHGKTFDEQIVAALLGSASGGYDGTSSTAFDSNQVIAAGGTGLTVAKLNLGLQTLQANEVDIQSTTIYLLVNANGLNDLMNDTLFTSFFYQDIKPLAGKTLPSFRGIKILHTERLPIVSAGATDRAILVTEDALKVAMAEDLEVKMSERPDLNFAIQLSTYMMYGAVRMEEKRVVDIQFVF